ncbi:MAG: hypothetical protein EXR55_04175 [Dehalococcoidia bacterium]|nr:hypothetical protein [Dehalococcoidia bacterium]
MPEAPDLAVIVEARVARPLVLRSLATPDFEGDVVGKAFQGFSRRGKFLLAHLSGERLLVINTMLTGALQHCDPTERVAKRTFILLTLSDGWQLRYLDERKMGMVYYITPDQLPQVPRLMEQGPDVLDEPLTFEEFSGRLRRYPGEIKGVMTRGKVVIGIGNAYTDEICFGAGLFPFHKRSGLSPDGLRRLHEAVYRVPREALPILRKRMGDSIHIKVRDSLKVHNKGGQPCLVCGHPLAEVTANQRITTYCRHCQPEMLVRN